PGPAARHRGRLPRARHAPGGAPLGFSLTLPVHGNTDRSARSQAGPAAGDEGAQRDDESDGKSNAERSADQLPAAAPSQPKQPAQGLHQPTPSAMRPWSRIVRAENSSASS